MKSFSHARLVATPWPVACINLLPQWDFLGKSTGVDCHFLLQRIFPTQGSNPSLPHCRQMLYHLSYQGSPSGSSRCREKINVNIYQVLLSHRLSFLVNSTQSREHKYLRIYRKKKNLSHSYSTYIIALKFSFYCFISKIEFLPL